MILVPMPEEVFARMVGAHMISDHMVIATASAESEKAAVPATSAEKK